MANKRLNALITIGGAVSGSLKGAFGSLKGSISNIGGTVADLNRKQRLLNDSIKRFGEQGLNVDKLKSKYAAQARQIDQLTAAHRRLNSVQARTEKNESRKQGMRAGIGETIAGAIAVGYPIKAAMEFEDKIAEVRKVVDAPSGMDKNTYFGQLGQQILDLSQKIPMTASQIGDLVAAGGQSGIASNELIKFAEAAGKMGVAFDITAETAGQSMAEMKSAFRMTLPEVIELGDKINALSNVGAASASDVMDIVKRIGPLGEVANVSSGQIAALGSTLRGMGVQNEIAATGIKNLMLTLTSGAKATKGQKEALKQLGYGSKQVAGSMQKDSRATITTILKSINRLDKVHRPEVLNALFGKEVVGSIAPLLNNIGELERQFDLVGDKTQWAGSMQKEFESRAATTSNSLILLRNRMNRIAITIGSAVLPQLNALINASFPYIDQISTMVQQHPQLTQAIVATGAAIVGLRIIALGSGFVWTTLNGYWLAGVKALTMLDSGLVKAGINWRLFNMAMIASPVGLVIAGVALAVGALSLAIYRNWDIIKSFISGAITPLWEGIKPVRDAFSGLWDLVVSFGKDIGITGESVKKFTTWFSELFTPINHSKDALDGAKKSGSEFGTVMANAINFVYQPLIKLVEAFKWLDTNVGGIMEKAQTFGHKEIRGAAGAVGGFFQNLFGTGEDRPTVPTGNGWGLAPPAVPEMYRGAGSQQSTDNSTTHITVVQRPGENGPEFARRVVEEQRKAKAQKNNSAMPDNLAIP